MSPGETCVISDSDFVSVNSLSAARFQRTRLTISTGLMAMLGKERHGDGNEVL